MAVDVGSAKGYLDLDISGFLNGLRTAQSEADTASKNIATKIGGNLSSVGKSFSSAGSTLTKNVTLPLLAVGGAGIKVASDFEKGMSEVKAISGATGEEFDALKNQAIELGADTAFSAGEVAEAMVEMAKAGWSSQQILDGMGGVLDAAAASGEGLASVSTIVADAITGFGLEASDSTRIADLLTQAANSGTIGITDLGESFKYMAPVAGAMGLSVEDVTTAISAMSMAGIKGSQAGTSLRTMLTNLVKPTDAMAVAMEELGISVTNQDGSMKSLDEIVANLRTSFSGLSESEKAYYAATLAGKEGMSGMLALLNLTEEEYAAIATSMDNSGGIAKQTAEVMQDNLQSKVEQLGGALESLAIKLTDLILPYLQDFVVWLTKLVDKFTSLDPETQKTILKFAGIAAAAGPVLSVTGKLTSGVGGLVTTFGKAPGAITKMAGGIAKLTGATLPAATGTATLGSSFGALGAAIAPVAGTIAAVVAIVGTLVAAFMTLWNTNEEFRESIIVIWNQIKETFDNFCQGIVDRLNALGFDFENIGEVLKAIWQGFCEFLAPIFEFWFQYIADTFDFIVNQILTIFDFFVALFKGDWEGVWEAIKSFFVNIWNYLVSYFENLWNAFLGLLDTVLGWFGTTWEECWNGIKSFFEGIWNAIVSFFTGLWDGIINTVKMAWDAIVSVLSTVANWVYDYVIKPVADFFTGLWDGITGAASACWNAIVSIWKVVSGWFNDTIIKPIANFFTGMWDGLKNGASKAWDGIKSVFSNVTNWFKDVFSKAWQAVKNVFSTGGKIFDGIKDGIVNAFKTVVNAIIGGINKVIKVPFDGINSALKSIKKIEIVGIKPFDWISTISVPQIPLLAKGAVLPANNPFLAIVGDQKRGTNIEAPLTTIQEAVAEVIKSFAYDIITLQRLALSVLSEARDELGYISYHGFKKSNSAFGKLQENNPNSPSGDTYIFNSPKPIDEIEAAKQMKKAKRDLAEGF